MVQSPHSWIAAFTPPLSLAYLASTLREAGHTVHAIDAIAEALDQYLVDDGYYFQGLSIEETVDRIDPATDIIGVSCMFTQDWPWLRRVLRAIRQRLPDTPIVVGGEHVTACPEFSLRDCSEIDWCVLGEGEATLVELVANLGDRDACDRVPGLAMVRDGQFVQSAPRARIREVDKIPWPAWDLFPVEKYLTSHNGHGVNLGRSMPILATRGCPYKCTFCSNPVMYGNLWMPRQPADVLDEIEHYLHAYGAENIDFYDLTMIVRKSWILEFCQLIEARGLKFTWQLPTGTRSEVIDDEVSAALYRTGCRNVTFAPESGSPETLRDIKKQVDLDKVAASMRTALRHGITIKCNLIIGFPHETRRQIWQTVRFYWKLAVLGVEVSSIYVFSPYPGSALYDELRADGTIGELGDEYFRSLAAFADAIDASSYSKHVGSRELFWWRTLAMLMFMAISFALRPVRLLRLVRNVFWTQRSESVLELRLGGMLKRLRTPKKQLAEVGLGTRPVGAPGLSHPAAALSNAAAS
jgi:radical SAM superfamily enzyme YgiQ (UPF0313 family)